MQFHKIIITNIPSFYKINLYNRISIKQNIFVIFTGDTASFRNQDFFSGEMHFNYKYLTSGSIISKVLEFINQFRKYTYGEIIIGGWDSIYMWIAAFYPKSSKKSVVIESSILESVSSGFKGLIKKIFISRISLAYVSGQSQKELLQKLHFKGRIIITKGVGIFNVRPQPQFIIVKEVSKFIYVGRLSPEKNLRYLIETLNELPYLSLSIIGYGPQESFLRSIAGPNIIFYGAVPNAELYKVYQSNDVFILPSISEPWGMVVEEAINNGLPVIVSDRVGCGSEIINENNGIIYNSSVHDDLKRAILKMLDIDYYNSLRHNISKMNFEMIAEEQVRCYL